MVSKCNLTGVEAMKRFPKTVLVRKSHTVDLECCGEFKLEEGQTYYDDGTTVFDAYIKGGIEDGWLEEAKRGRDTVTVSAKELLRQ
jgi:hypothetical protein